MVSPKYVVAHGDFDPFNRGATAGIQGGVGLMERQESGAYRQVGIFHDEKTGLAVLAAELLSGEAATLEATKDAEW